MKNLKHLNEERSAVKDAVKKEATRGCPRLEKPRRMRSVANRHRRRRHYAQLMTSTVLVEAKHVDHQGNKARSCQKFGETIAVKFNQFTLPSHSGRHQLKEEK